MSRLVAVGNFYGAHVPFQALFDTTIVAKPQNKYVPEKGDVLLFGGGEDISPSLYNQKPNRYCGADSQLSLRDAWESDMFKIAVAHKVPMIGICRGAQLLCALSGGSLYQHVTHHAGSDHAMETSEGTVLKVCSVHHQMMNPHNTKHKMLGWAREVLSPVHLVENEKNVEVEIEPEVVYFEDTNALAIQYHPEFMYDGEEAVEYARQMVTKYLLKGDKNAAVQL